MKLVKLKSGLDFPMPDEVNENGWKKFLVDNQTDIEKSFKGAGVKVIRFNPKDSFHEYFNLKKDKDTFKLGISNISSPTKMAVFKKIMKKLNIVIDVVDELYNSRKDVGDIFYSDITPQVKKKFPSNQDSRQLAFSIVTDILRNRGLKIVS